LERENDLAFDEVFENDLREWIRRASDEEKEFIRNMNLNKWCGLPTFKDSEKMVVFNTGKGEFQFIRTDGIRVERELNQLKALRQIRSFDNARKTETINFEDKTRLVSIAKKVFEAESAYQTTMEGVDLSEFMGVKSSAGNGTLTSAKQQLLDLLHANEDR